MLHIHTHKHRNIHSKQQDMETSLFLSPGAFQYYDYEENRKHEERNIESSIIL